MKFVFTVVALGALLTGCGDHNHGEHTDHHSSDQKQEGIKLVENLPDGMAAAQGVVTGFTDELVMIKHGDIQGAGMGPMTMGFGFLNDMDASALKEGDEIAFLLKIGRDDSLRIVGYCKPAQDGQDCLQSLL